MHARAIKGWVYFILFGQNCADNKLLVLRLSYRSDSNVGFFARNAEEFEWLRRLLSVDQVKELLADEYNGKEIVSIFIFVIVFLC